MYERLINRQKPILVSVVGAGEFGREVITQITHVPNMEIVGVSDSCLEAAVSSLKAAGYKDCDICCAKDSESARKSLDEGRKVVVRDPMILCDLPGDALCDCTGDPDFGARFAYTGLNRKKHLIVVNIESTVSVGHVLSRIAKENGVVYTVADGDQPSLIVGLCEWARCLGMEVEVAGKWTSNMKESIDTAKEKRSVIGSSDGSKHQVEMCCVANITGLVPDVTGMHFPSVAFENTLPTLALRKDGGILKRKGVVEMVGFLNEENQSIVPYELRGGVFVIASCENPEFRRAALGKYLVASKDGRRILFYRPYHFVGIETPISIMRAVLYGEATGAPLPDPVADVYAIAKRDLRAGECLDGIGGAMVRGEIECCTEAKKSDRLPLALAENVILKKPVKEGEFLTMDMLEKPGDSFIWKLYAETGL